MANSSNVPHKGSESDEARPRYVPALRFRTLTALYDPVVAITTRERTFKTRLLAQASLRPGHQVLDLGCGTGTLVLEAWREEPQAQLVGLDGDREVLDRAAAKAANRRARLALTEGFSDALPFPDRSFDRVLSTLFFHHLTRDAKRRTLREVARVLSCGGEFHVADWGRPETRLMRVASWPLRVFDGVEQTRDNIEGLLPELMRSAGLTDVETIGGLPTVFGTMAFYRAVAPA